MNIPGDEENRARQWRPTDPRQSETRRRLLLFGNAPAAHFRDACRMMDGIDLLATTHLVAHSLRECDAAVRGVMFSMLSAEQRAVVEAAAMKHREQIEQMCTLLGFADDDVIRSQWWAWAQRLHELTHRHSLRGPRPVDGEFRDWWAQGQAVLYRMARQFETVYGEALPRVEQLAATDAPVAADLSELREGLPHGDVALERFFTTATPGWFALLREGDYFADPPPLQPDAEGRVAYVPWPPGSYLVRLVADEQHRADVVALARALGDTDNPAAREAVVDIALAVPAEAAVELAEQVAAFLTSPFQWRLPFKVRELVVHLAAGGQSAAALALLRPLVSPSTPAGERWRSTALLEELVPELFPAVGLAGLECLAGLLDEQLEGDARTRERDYSYMWRPTLEGGRARDLRDALVTALRDAAACVVEADPERLSAVVAFLEGRAGSIFARLALNLLRRFPDDELVAERLRDHARFADPNLEREWTLLAQERFATLPAAIRDSILGWVEAGPDDAGEGAAGAERRERWQRLQLTRLGDALPEQWRTRRDELVERYGQPDRRPFVRAIWSGTSAPLTKEEFAARSVEEIIGYLDSWTPEGELDSPSIEGLSRLFAEVVAEEPGRFAAAAESFIDVEPTYAHHMLSGLVKAAWEGQEFPWPPVLALAAAALEQPRLLESRPERGSGDLDPGWIWTRLEIARLLSAGLEKDRVPAELADEVWALLAQLTEDPEPDLAYEAEWADGGMGPSGLSLNTVRGSAMQAVMHYMWWRKLQTPAGEQPVLEPRLRQLLDRRLDPVVEPTRTVRSVYGQWFPYLVAADGDWSAERAPEIFPLTGEQVALGREAWDSYLRHNGVYESVVERLWPQYAAAIERAAAGDADDAEAREQLLGHLISLYVRARLELDDELLGRFLAEAPVDLRAQLIESIGIDVMNADELPEDGLARLRALWESRLAATVAAGGGGGFRELRGFGWWFGSAKFDDRWSLTQLTALLEAGGTVDPDHVVVERLAALRDAELPEVLRALAALIDVTDEPWFVLGSRDEIRAILEAGLQSAVDAVQRTARAATNRLVARGHPEFSDLLQ